MHRMQLLDKEMGAVLAMKKADKAAAGAAFEPVVRSWEHGYYMNQVSRLYALAGSNRFAPMGSAPHATTFAGQSAHDHKRHTRHVLTPAFRL